MNLATTRTIFGFLKKQVICSLVLCMLFASKLDETKFIGYFSTLTIEPVKESPAYAAMEDIGSELKSLSQDNKVVGTVELEANEDFDFNKYFSNTQATVKKLSGIVITKAAPTKESQPIKVIGEIKTIAENDFEVYQEDGRLKPLVVRKKELAAYYSNTDFSIESVSERANELIKEELTKQAAQSPQNKHENIFVQIPKHNIKTIAAASTSPVQKPKPNPEPKVDDKSSVEEHQQKRDFKLANKTKPAKYVIEGHFVLTGGVAFTGINETIDIYLVRKSEIVDTAIVDLRSGKFYLETGSLDGTLVAEIRSDDGKTHGIGEYSLYDLSEEQVYLPHVKDLDIAIKPYEEGVDIEVISAYSFDNVKYQVDNTKVIISGLERQLTKNDEGDFTDKSIVNGSTFLARAYAPRHWGSLSIGLTGVKETIRLFSETMIDSLLNLILGKYEARSAHQKGIIWGEVTANGMALEGAKVEIAGQEELAPVYYNQVIPDRKLEKTSSSGQFVFLNVIPGTYALRVKHNGHTYPAEVVAVDSGHVSYIQLKIAKNKMYEVKTFDAFSGYGLQSIYSIFGYDKEYETNPQGEDLTYVPRGSGVVLFDVDAGENYPIQRMAGYRKASSVEIPLVQQKWLEGLAIKKRINIELTKGIVVGFVETTDFDAFIEDTVQSNTEIIYFDSKGNIAKKGQAGGGFVMFNQKIGPQTVSILPKGSTDVVTHLVVTDTESVFVTKF